MALSRKRRLACTVFMALWGGWVVVAILIALVLPRFLFNANETAGGITVLFLTGLALGAWEKHFRKKHLPTVAQRPWHAWLVIFPLCLAGLLPKYAHHLCNYLPGGLRHSVTFIYWGTPDASGDRVALFPMDVIMTNRGWGPDVSPRRALIKTDPAWSVDCRALDLTNEKGTVAFDQKGAVSLLASVAPELDQPGQDELAVILLDHLRDGRFPIPGSTEFEITVLSATTGTARIPWTVITAGLFSLLLLPVTWLVVRFTMFPAGIPLPEVDG